MLSACKLPYLAATGGYASHVGIAASDAPRGASLEDRGIWMRDSLVEPLFRLREGGGEAPYYVYLNIDDASHLRAVLADPATHAPNGIYIMRIHGTFVNFLDLSTAIQEDIIRRLDLAREAA
jgi:formate C-acetyltransferase